MRIVMLLLLCTVGVPAEEKTPRASRIVDGEVVPFDPKGVDAGVKTALALLHACHSDDWRPGKPTRADLNEVLKKDHVRIRFSSPQKYKYKDAEMVFTELIIGSGGCWFESGNRVHRFTKYGHREWGAFLKWHREPGPAAPR